MYQFLTAIERPVHIVNLDPANDHVPYPCAISLAELISVRDVMEELDLGPNGAMLYCLEYLEHNLDWLEARLEALEGDYVVFDLPGQVELSTNHPSLARILTRLQKQQDWRVGRCAGSRTQFVAVHLADATNITDVSRYISLLILALRAMLMLELPHVNVLSKMDLLDDEQKAQLGAYRRRARELTRRLPAGLLYRGAGPLVPRGAPRRDAAARRGDEPRAVRAGGRVRPGQLRDARGGGPGVDAAPAPRSRQGDWLRSSWGCSTCIEVQAARRGEGGSSSDDAANRDGRNRLWGFAFFARLGMRARVSWLATALAPLAVWAAGSSPSSINGTSLIPANISSSCYTLLVQLDSDSLFQQCTDPLIQATAIYANASSSNATESSLTHSLDSLCSQQNGCDRTLVRQYVAQFWDECSAELEAGNDEVTQLYDYLYIFNPFRDAICSKNTNGTYCLESLAPYMRPSADLQALQLDAVPDAGDVYSEQYWAHVLSTVPTSNAKAAQSTSALNADQVFLFLSGSTDRDTLCSECTQNVLASYIGFEMATPYALGVERSDVLSPQVTIYNNARKMCGEPFVAAISTRAGVSEFPSAAARAPRALALWGSVVGVAALALLELYS